MAKEAKKKSPSAAGDSDQKLQELESQLAAAQTAKLQVMADFDNFRKRMDAEKSKFGLMSNMLLVSAILEILDEVAMAQNDETLDLDRAKQVFSIFNDKLGSALNVAGLEKVEIKLGDKFDAALAEAITTVPVPEAQDQTIVAVISYPYKYKGQDGLLRSGKVVVGKKS